MCSLVMSPFLRDYQQCFNLLKSVQYSHNTWFLDINTCYNYLALNYPQQFFH